MACDHTPAARSSKYALRSYLYLLLHAAVAGPAALLFGTGAGAALHTRHTVFHVPLAECALQATRGQHSEHDCSRAIQVVKAGLRCFAHCQSPCCSWTDTWAYSMPVSRNALLCM